MGGGGGSSLDHSRAQELRMARTSLAHICMRQWHQALLITVLHSHLYAAFFAQLGSCDLQPNRLKHKSSTPNIVHLAFSYWTFNIRLSDSILIFIFIFNTPIARTVAMPFHPHGNTPQLYTRTRILSYKSPAGKKVKKKRVNWICEMCVICMEGIASCL